MNQSLVVLLQATRRALRDSVLPELDTDYARSQLAAAVDILSKLEHLVVWSPDVLRDRLAAIDEGRAAIIARAEAAGCKLPPSASRISSPQDQAELEQSVRSGEQWLIALSDWLFDPENELSANQREEIDTILLDSMRDALVMERRLVSGANYSSMAAAGS